MQQAQFESNHPFKPALSRGTQKILREHKPLLDFAKPEVMNQRFSLFAVSVYDLYVWG